MKLGIVGRGISYTLSPRIFALLGEWADRPVDYQVFDQLEWNPKEWSDRDAVSVTIPYKVEALALAFEVDETAQAVGSANLLVRSPNGWRAYNTDLAGLEESLPLSQLSGQGILLGAGGAARSALALVRRHGGRLTILNRNPERAQELAAENVNFTLSPEAGYDFLIKATPEVDSQTMQETLKVLKPSSFVMDMAYRPIQTNLLTAAAEKGLATVDGLEMLVAQALAAWKILTGWNFDSDVRPRLRRELERSL